MSQTPAGWYPDPEDPSQQRYWDGYAWTEHRTPSAPSAPSDPSAPPAWSGGYGGTPGSYGSAPGYAGPPSESSGRAVTSLILGIVGLVTCLGPITGIPAMILGKQATREIDASGGRLEGRGLATAGFVTGLIATVLGVLGILLIVGLFAFGSTVQSSFEQSCESAQPSPGLVDTSC